ncbi:hypothetical protein ACJX0J_030216 [Zea mays]
MHKPLQQSFCFMMNYFLPRHIWSSIMQTYPKLALVNSFELRLLVAPSELIFQSMGQYLIESIFRWHAVPIILNQNKILIHLLRLKSIVCACYLVQCSGWNFEENSLTLSKLIGGLPMAGITQ